MRVGEPIVRPGASRRLETIQVELALGDDHRPGRRALAVAVDRGAREGVVRADRLLLVDLRSEHVGVPELNVPEHVAVLAQLAARDLGVRRERAVRHAVEPVGHLGEPDGVREIRALARQGLRVDQEALHHRGQDGRVGELGEGHGDQHDHREHPGASQRAVEERRRAGERDDHQRPQPGKHHVHLRVAGTGQLPAVARQLETEPGEPVLPGGDHEQQGAEHEQVRVRAPRGRDRRWLRADRACGGMREDRADEREPHREEKPVGDLLVQRQGEDEESDIPVEDRIGDPKVAPVQPQEDLLPAGVHHAAADHEPGSHRERQVCRQHDAPQADRAGVVPRQLGVTRRETLDDPEIGDQEHRRGEPGEARGHPPALENRPESSLLSQLAEPEPLGLELREYPRGPGHGAEHAQEQGGAHARPPPPGRIARRCRGATERTRTGGGERCHRQIVSAGGSSSTSGAIHVNAAGC